MAFWIGLIIGLVAGAYFGLVMVVLLAGAHEGDRGRVIDVDWMSSRASSTGWE
jgi:hypothetical protein